ncbi:hypothetical protein ACIBHX_15435 [Nonomuraea sp. NPDC050536]|uniref:hypothetical protein n=1 Tax=Nonomuraea sp. NPDC050536 TaxID=3364366 RepID=UPI0037C6F858
MTVLSPPGVVADVPVAGPRHRLFLLVLVPAAALRVLIMLAYDSAQVYWYDSFEYLDMAVHPRPGEQFHPAGYSWFLWLLRPFHSVQVIAGIQHALGLGVAVLIYLLLRRYAVPAWGATLACVPVLFDPAFLRQEHAILSDLQVYALLLAALAVLMWHERVTARAAAVSALLVALAGLTRTAAAPLLVLVVGYLLVRRAGWRPVAVAVAAGALPLVAYAGWFQAAYGRFTLTGADGVSLWARTMTFADCRVIEPPRDLARLCPNGTRLDAASEYVWDAHASINLMPGGRYAANALAKRFAVAAILAQPLDYLRNVAADTSLAFTWIPVAHPRRVSSGLSFPHVSMTLPAGQPLIDKVKAEYDPDIHGLTSVEPYGTVLSAYTYPWVLHAPVFGLILLAGGVGGLWRDRRALLPWAFSVALLVGPVAVLDFDQRYVTPAIPFACIAAAMALRTRTHGRNVP